MLDKQVMITAENALPGRSTPMTIDDTHFINQTSMTAPPKEGEEHVLIGMGCFWGVERLFWQLDGVVSTSVGYSGGFTPNPTYEEVCTGQTGHAEVVHPVAAEACAMGAVHRRSGGAAADGNDSIPAETPARTAIGVAGGARGRSQRHAAA